MSEFEDVSASKLKDAAENFERIRQRIGPFMPIRADTPISARSDWKSVDEYAKPVVREAASPPNNHPGLHTTGDSPRQAAFNRSCLGYVPSPYPIS